MNCLVLHLICGTSSLLATIFCRILHIRYAGERCAACWLALFDPPSGGSQSALLAQARLFLIASTLLLSSPVVSGTVLSLYYALPPDVSCEHIHTYIHCNHIGCLHSDTFCAGSWPLFKAQCRRGSKWEVFCRGRARCEFHAAGSHRALHFLNASTWWCNLRPPLVPL
jgi:hypothetical protein